MGKHLPDVEYARLDIMWQGMVLEVDELKRKLNTEKNRALDAERELAALEKTSAALREFVIEEADNDCYYGDNCPSNAGTRHGTCRSCKARQTLAACGIHVWFEHDDLEACRNCGVVRREDDGNKPCKGKVALVLR